MKRHPQQDLIDAEGERLTREIRQQQIQEACYQRATLAGTKNFEDLAKLHEKEIKTCEYRDLQNIIADTWGVINGKDCIIEQNLQYFPYKVRYFELN